MAPASEAQGSAAQVPNQVPSAVTVSSNPSQWSTQSQWQTLCQPFSNSGSNMSRREFTDSWSSGVPSHINSSSGLMAGADSGLWGFNPPTPTRPERAELRACRTSSALGLSSGVGRGARCGFCT
jgi:hypothetical protein